MSMSSLRLSAEIFCFDWPTLICESFQDGGPARCSYFIQGYYGQLFRLLDRLLERLDTDHVLF